MRSVAIPIALAVLAGPWIGSASAQDESEGSDGSAAVSADVTEERQMTLPAGRWFIQAFAEINLSEDLVAKPISIAPDVWYGVSDVLTIGVVHSARAATGFFGNAGDGLCLTGSDNGCGKVYNSVGIDGRYHFYREGGITAAADGGLFAQSIDPFQLALKVGAVGRWQSGSVAVELGASLFVGLTERDGVDGDDIVVATTNKEISCQRP